jgi:hypothetical protein
MIVGLAEISAHNEFRMNSLEISSLIPYLLLTARKISGQSFGGLSYSVERIVALKREHNRIISSKYKRNVRWLIKLLICHARKRHN